MADVTGSIGNQPVELDNAATEKTLREILASINRLNGTIVRGGGSGGGGGGSGGGGGGGPSSSIPAFNALNVVLGLVRGTFNFLSNVVAGLATAIGATTGLFVNIADEAIQGKLSLSSFYTNLENVASQIPIIGGLLGGVIGLFAKLAEMQEQELASYRKITDSGVNFAGSLTQLRANALSLGMTLDQFSEFVEKNREALSIMGNNANAGAETFVKLSTSIQKSDVGGLLRGLGYDLQGMSQGLASYIAMTGGRTSEEMKNTKGLTVAAGEYMSQLDMLSQITGKQRKQIEEEVAKASANAAYQAYLQTLDEDGRKKAAIAMQNALAAGGEAGADILKSQLLGLPPMTEAAQKLTALGPNVASGIKEMGDAVANTKKTSDDVNRGFAKAQIGASQDMEKFGKSAQALSFGSGAVSTALMGMQAQANRNTDQGIKNLADAEAQHAKIAEEQRTRQKSAAAQASETEKSMKDLGSSIYGMLRPAIEVITPIINDLATSIMNSMSNGVTPFGEKVKEFADYVKDHLPAIKAALKDAIDAIGQFGKNLLSPEGRDKIVNDLQYGFNLLMIELKKTVRPFYDEEDAAEARKILDEERRQKNLALDAQLRAREQAEREAALKKPSEEPPKRMFGSLGTSGKLFENWGSGTIAELHGLEAVVTPEQMSDIVKNAASGAINSVSKLGESKDPIGDVLSALTGTAPKEDKLTDHIIRLNTLTEQMLTAMKETATLMKKNVDATQSLRGNLFV